jgi:hypothetical protein
VNGGYGSGGYPGQGYDEDPDLNRSRQRRGAPRQWDGPARQNDRGYGGPEYGGPEYGGPEYGGPGYNEPGYGAGYRGDPGYDPRDYGQPDGRGGPVYGPPDGGAGGYRSQGASGSQPGQYGTGGRPQYDQPQYDQRGGAGPRRAARDRRGDNVRDQRGNGDWDQEDGSFLPGFAPRDEPGSGRPGGFVPERDGRYDDYDDRHAPRGGG